MIRLTLDSLARGVVGRVGRNDQQVESIHPDQLPGIMVKHIYTGAMGMTYATLMTGLFLTAFGSALGVTYWQWGLLGWAGSLATLFQLVGASLTNRIGNRKYLWFIPALVGRMLRATGIMVAFLLMDAAPSAARLVLVVVLVFGEVCGALATPPWFSWLAGIIPQRIHASFMGRRSAWIALANMAVVVPLGFMVDKAPDPLKVPALMCVFAFGFSVGIVDLFIHRTIPEPRMPTPARTHFWREVAVPLLDPAFRPWLIFAACWTFSMTLGGGLATVYFVENLGISRNMLGGSLVLVVVPLLVSMLAAKRAGMLVDRYGGRHMLRWGYLCCAVTPIFWMLASRETAMYWLAAGSVVGGLGSVAAAAASSKFIIRLPPAEHVAMYVAVSTCVGGLVGGFGALIAGFLLSALKGQSWTLGGATIVGFHLVFAASLLLGLASTLLLCRVAEPPDRDAAPAPRP